MSRRFVRVAALSIVVGGALAGLPARGKEKPVEPSVVVVQHVLIGFKGSVRGKKIERTKAEAETLARDLLRRAQEGEDFDALVREYTDDSAPGVYKLTNRGAPLRSDARTREQMVPGFGDVAFRLAVGEIGLTEYRAASSPYGWHVIRRLE